MFELQLTAGLEGALNCIERLIDERQLRDEEWDSRWARQEDSKWIIDSDKATDFAFRRRYQCFSLLVSRSHR